MKFAAVAVRTLKSHIRQLHNFMFYKSLLFSKTIVTAFALSLLVIFLGVAGIIEHKSPAEISSLTTLSTSFLSNIKYHALIIIGALCFTFSVWFVGKNSK